MRRPLLRFAVSANILYVDIIVASWIMRSQFEVGSWNKDLRLKVSWDFAGASLTPARNVFRIPKERDRERRTFGFVIRPPTLENELRRIGEPFLYLFKRCLSIYFIKCYFRPTSVTS